MEISRKSKSILQDKYYVTKSLTNKLFWKPMSKTHQESNNKIYQIMTRGLKNKTKKSKEKI